MTFNTLVLDCDGTLLTSKGEVDSITKAALIDFQKKGNRLILASGRPPQGMFPIVKELEMDKYNTHIISFNGAEIYQTKDNKRIYKNYLSLEDQTKIVEIIVNEGLVALTYNENNLILNGTGPYAHEEARLTGMNEIIDPVFFQKNHHQYPKIMGIGDPTTVRKLELKYENFFTKNTSVTTSQPFFLEFINSTTSKGIALRHLADIADLSLKEMISAGDSNNDIPLLKATGKGIVMENGTATLSKIADEKTASNDNFGIVEIIEKFF